MSDQGPNNPGEQPPQPPEQPPGWAAPPEQQPPGWSAPPPPPQQGQPAQWGQPAPHVPDYLIVSILETVFCCVPAGVVGIVFSSRATSKKNTGDFAGAIQDSQTAKKWLLIGAIGTIVLTIGFFLLFILLAAIGSSSGSSSDF